MRFGLGVLRYRPDELGVMRVGSFLDAMTGYNEAEGERVKSIAELIRTSTWMLWNIQVKQEDRSARPQDLWGFAWDRKEEAEGPQVSEEDLKALEEIQKKIIEKM